MMRNLISIILVIFAIGAIYAESEEQSLDVNNCNEQIDNENNLIDSCTDQIFNSTVFDNELDTTLLKYTGDNDAVLAFANKYCPILNEVVQCRFAGNISVECRHPRDAESVIRRFSLVTAVLNYACANKAAVLINVLESNGLETIYDNSNFFQCLGFILTPLTTDYIAETVEICNGIDKAIECYKDTVRNHKNQNLVAIANELRAVYHQTIKCDTANQI